LPLLEVKALRGLGEWKRIIEVAHGTAENALTGGKAHDAFTLFFAESRAREVLADFDGALAALKEAEESAGQINEVDLLVRVAAARYRLESLRNTDSEAKPTVESSAEPAFMRGLLQSGAIDRLAGAPLREVAAARGMWNPRW